MAEAQRRKRGRPTNEEAAERIAADPAEEIAGILDQLGAADATIRLMRQRREPPRIYQHLAMLPLSLDMIEEVQAQFGGGDYKAHVHNGPERVKGRTVTFSIAGKPKAFHADDETAQPDRIAALQDEIRQLREAQTKDDGVAKIVATFTAITTALTPLVKPLLENMGSNKGGDLNGTLMLLQAAETKGEARGRELGKLLAGGGSEHSMSDVALAYLPTLKDMVAARKNAPTPAALSTVSPSPVTDAPAPMPGQTQNTDDLPAEYEWLRIVRPIYGRLQQQAQLNVDASLIAEYAMAQVSAQSDELADAIEAATQRADFRERMRQELAPIAARHAQWVDEFITAVIEQCGPEDSEHATPITTKKVTRQPRRTA